jgi:tetratricopeptide (TPR) repeat protein
MTDEDLFHAAAALPEDQRAAYLAERCPDPDRRRQVEDLLAAHDRPAGPLDNPATGAYVSAPRVAVGAVFAGRYKLREVLGEGGMGTVYVADQTEPVQRRVALKVIRTGVDSARMLARFEQERQALALMDHPNIAKVFDAGVADGVPYFAMELIKGVPITRYCDEARLTPRQRLELFVPVCQAVQHAHQKGIIHRDLKPSNVLIGLYDGRPVPKVIDFGVAKVTGPRLTEKSVYTEVGSLVGTLEYMAPEQAELNNLDVDTRADVYALGVILYELLTGAVPFTRKELQAAGFAEMLRVIKEVEPVKPSTKLSGSGTLPSVAAARGLDPRRLAQQLRGELDWITMKCLEKERSRRYETANQLALEVQRYLADEPVLAGPPSAAYRVRKLARRYRGALLTAAAFAAVLAAAAAVSIWEAVQARRAEATALAARDAEAEQRRRTRAALDDMLSEESLAFLTTQKDLLPAQRAFLERALKYYREFAAQAATDHEGRELEAGAQFRVALIYQTLGRPADAEASFRAARALYDSLAAEHPGVMEYRQNLAKSRDNLGVLLRDLGRHAEAEAEFRLALAAQEKLNAERPGVPEYQRELAASHNNLGNLLSYLGRYAEAEGECRAALRAQQRLAAEHPGVPIYAQDVARSHINLGDLLQYLGRRPEAEAEYHSAMVLYERLAAEHPAVPEYRWDLARSHNNLGNLLRDLGRHAELESEYRAALALYERLAAEHPALPEYRRGIAGSHNNLGLLLQEMGRRPEAEAEFRSALAAHERLVTEHPAEPEYRRGLAGSHINLGILLAHMGKRLEAEAEFRSGLALYERLAAEHPAVRGYAAELGRIYCNLGELARDPGEPAVALGWYAKAIATLEPLYRADPRVFAAKQVLAYSHRARAQVLTGLGRPTEALADWERALALDDGSARTALRLGRGDALARAGETTKALAAADELATERRLTAEQHYDLACVYALAAAKLPPANGGDAAAKAVAAVRQAVKAGYHDVPHLLQDSDLNSLRGRADFADLLWDLADAN